MDRPSMGRPRQRIELHDSLMSHITRSVSSSDLSKPPRSDSFGSVEDELKLSCATTPHGYSEPSSPENSSGDEQVAIRCPGQLPAMSLSGVSLNFPQCVVVQVAQQAPIKSEQEDHEDYADIIRQATLNAMGIQGIQGAEMDAMTNIPSAGDVAQYDSTP